MLALAAILDGCSVVVPSSRSESWRADAQDTTGSIVKPTPELARGLEIEDKRRANAALATALDPQGEGGSVNWDNAQTGAKGSFTPVGHAYPTEAKICRAFLAEVDVKEAHERLQGTACRERSNDWTITEAKPWRKS